jgi:hypothetical protein
MDRRGPRPPSSRAADPRRVPLRAPLRLERTRPAQPAAPPRDRLRMGVQLPGPHAGLRAHRPSRRDRRATVSLLTAAGIGSMASSLELAARRYSRTRSTAGTCSSASWSSRRGPRALDEPALRRWPLVCQLSRRLRDGALPGDHDTLLQLVVDDGLSRARDGPPHRHVPRHGQPAGSLVLGGLAQSFGARRAGARVRDRLACRPPRGSRFRLRRVAMRERSAASVSVPPLHVFSDFDGTITDRDTLVFLGERLGGGIRMRQVTRPSSCASGRSVSASASAANMRPASARRSPRPRRCCAPRSRSTRRSRPFRRLVRHARRPRSRS